MIWHCSTIQVHQSVRLGGGGKIYQGTICCHLENPVQEGRPMYNNSDTIRGRHWTTDKCWIGILCSSRNQQGENHLTVFSSKGARDRIPSVRGFKMEYWYLNKKKIMLINFPS